MHRHTVDVFIARDHRKWTYQPYSETPFQIQLHCRKVRQKVQLPPLQSSGVYVAVPSLVREAVGGGLVALREDCPEDMTGADSACDCMSVAYLGEDIRELQFVTKP